MDYAASFAYFLSLLLNSAIVDAPPKELKTDSDVLRTCVYVDHHLGFSPEICQDYFTAVVICSKEVNPAPECFTLVGVNKVNPHNEQHE